MFYKSVYQFLILLFFIFLASASTSAAAVSCTRRGLRRRPAARRWRGGPLAEASEAPCPVAPSTSRREWQRPASRMIPPITPLLGRRRRYSNYFKLNLRWACVICFALSRQNLVFASIDKIVQLILISRFPSPNNFSLLFNRYCLLFTVQAFLEGATFPPLCLAAPLTNVSIYCNLYLICTFY